jgi:hypothetical protein
LVSGIVSKKSPITLSGVPYLSAERMRIETFEMRKKCHDDDLQEMANAGLTGITASNSLRTE